MLRITRLIWFTVNGIEGHMQPAIIRGIVGVAVALSVICLSAWLFLLVALFEHPTMHPFFLQGLSEWSHSRAPEILVVALFWMMPLWILLFGLRVRGHWQQGRSGLVPALLMNASSVPVLTAVSVFFMLSET
jgi:hypothetical protein